MPFVRPMAKSLSVDEALRGNRWVSEIYGSLSVQTIAEYLLVWESISEVALLDRPDGIRWKLTTNGVYSAQSAYQVFFKDLPRDTEAIHL
jgi:hypothetical protein